MSSTAIAIHSIKKLDLIKYYDKCEKEVAYDGINRRSDLKLYSSSAPQTPPVYIEFCVMHPSEYGKLHSGYKIIECTIEDEADINQIAQNGFIEVKNRDIESGQLSVSNC